MKPTLLLKVRGQHTFWATDRGIAVADQSMRVHGRPDTTDDGLLTILEDELAGSEAYYQVIGAAVPQICLRPCCDQAIPVKSWRDGKRYTVSATSTEFIDVCRLISRKRRGEPLEEAA